MDLFCPHCSRRVTVPDDNAGQVASCPLCAKQFMTPALAPPPTPSPPPPRPAQPQETYGMGPTSAPAPTSTPGKPSAPSKPEEPPPGDYTRTIGFTLRAEWLAFVPPACLFVIFFLSFFPWHNLALDKTPSLWGLSFVDQQLVDAKQGHFLAYTILMIFPTVPVVIAAVVLEKIFAPPQIAPFKKWIDFAAGMLLTITFLLLCIDYVDGHFLQKFNPIALTFKIAIRLHFVALVSSFLMFWLLGRKRNNLPAPKFEIRI